MKVQLLGIESMSFVGRKTGETVNMTKLHVVSPYKENTDEMRGRDATRSGRSWTAQSWSLEKHMTWYMNGRWVRARMRAPDW